jgi:uncharacterized protein (DUF934 family)
VADAPKPAEAPHPAILKLRSWKPAEGWTVLPETAAIVPGDMPKLVVKAVRDKADTHPVQFTAWLSSDAGPKQITDTLDESFADYAFHHPAFCQGRQDHP